MKINRGEAPGLVCVKGYSGIVLKPREFQLDAFNDEAIAEMDIRRNCFGGGPLRMPPLAAICEVVIGSPPAHWETCNPYGHYRVSVKNLRRLSTLEALALVSVDE